MKIKHGIRQKSTTIVLTDPDGKTLTFTSWEFVAKKLNVTPVSLRQKWSASDKNEPIEVDEFLIEKVVDNQI